MEDLDELKKLTTEHNNKQYISEALLWEWKYNLNKLKLSDINRERVRLKRESMTKDKEILELKLKLFKSNIESADRLKLESKNEYEVVKEKLEKFIGFSVEECVIDDETLEVKKLSEIQTGE